MISMVEISVFQVFMQNTNIKSYINNTKIVNIKSEILCREAEDDFYYFKKVNTAYKKLCEAVKLTPSHTKSILLLADICFIKGYIKKALNLYLQALQYIKQPRLYAAIANCYNIRGNYDSALEYCNYAIEFMTEEHLSLYSQVTEMKINILISQKKYKQAYNTFIKTQNILDKNSDIYNINYELLSEKINLQNKLKHSSLKIV